MCHNSFLLVGGVALFLFESQSTNQNQVLSTAVVSKRAGK